MVNQTKRRVPVCVYWNGDKFGYELFLAKYVRGAGWIEDLYLGFARDLKELKRIMAMFNYVPVCGISIDVDVTDAAPRDVADDDAVTRTIFQSS